MTKEDKNLLLKDLCARLPYNVKCYYQLTEKDCTIVGVWGDESVRIKDSIGREKWETVAVIKPYLRPTSSMTDVEKRDYQYITERWMYDSDYSIADSIDWLNEHHFDYRGLIEKGLAIEILEE